MKRVENIQIKVTTEEKKKIQSNAKKVGLDVSGFIRYKCLEKGEN